MGINYNARVVNRGLVLYLDAANPASLPVNSAIWKDLTTAGYTAYIRGTPTTSTSYGGAVTTPQNQTTTYVELPEAALQSLPNGLTWTMEWALTILSHSGTRYGPHMTVSGGNDFIWQWSTTDSQLFAGSLTSGTNPPWTLNVPANYTLTRNDSVWRIYKDGVFAAEYSLSTTDTRLIQGWILDQEADGLKGSFDPAQNLHADWHYIKLYNSVLTDAEILENFIALRGRSTLPNYIFGVIPASINEGSSGTFNVVTNNVADSTTLYWTIATNSGDFSTINGSFTITSNAGSFSVTPTADLTTEGAETFTVSIRTVSITGTVVATSSSVTINDTSLTPAIPTYIFGVIPASINEGSSGTFNVTTTDVANATTLYWTIATNAGDFSTINGSFTITSNAGSFSVTPTADLLTEGAETFTVSVRTVSITGTVVATSSSVTINDTSLSSLITSGLQLWLDVGRTASYPGTGTAWTDLTVNGRNGTIVNSPTYTSAGASSYLSFGSGASQRTSFTYQTPVQSAATAFTWDIWAYPVANQDSYILMGYRGTTPLQFYKLTTQKFEMYPAEIFYLFALNVWQNITAVYDGSQSGTANMKLYVNGTAVGLRDADQPDFSPSAMPFYVGGDPISSEFATARINQVAVYNRALSAGEISTNFNTFKGRFGL